MLLKKAVNKQNKNMKITKTGTAGIEIIKSMEGFRSAPYKCPAGIPTIGYGATFYPNGTKVTMSDTPITEVHGTDLLKSMLVSLERRLRELLHQHRLPFQRQLVVELLLFQHLQLRHVAFQKACFVVLSSM